MAWGGTKHFFNGKHLKKNSQKVWRAKTFQIVRYFKNFIWGGGGGGYNVTPFAVQVISNFMVPCLAQVHRHAQLQLGEREVDCKAPVTEVRGVVQLSSYFLELRSDTFLLIFVSAFFQQRRRWFFIWGVDGKSKEAIHCSKCDTGRWGMVAMECTL